MEVKEQYTPPRCEELEMNLEGIIAAVQAIRLEYYEFFSKFFPGGGEEFKPFKLG